MPTAISIAKIARTMAVITSVAMVHLLKVISREPASLDCAAGLFV
jgi:hypothetical protein